MRNFFLAVVFSLFYLNSEAQLTSQNSSEIILNLKKLNTLGSVLYIAAHPDDENTRLLAYLAKERKLKTAYLSLTRGDGGQNLVGKEQGDALGLIRTQELLAARKIDGAEQFFTRANDFGFSKNPEETFKIWNKDSILEDVVWAIRKFKPDVIICRFPATGEGGHGHHTASAILALEAFDAAADSSRFPQQLSYTQTWKAKRIFWNTFNFGGTNTTSPDQLKIDVGVYNPLLGKGYGEIASESRSMHKSQGFGSARSRGASLEYFKWLKGDSAKTDLFTGIDQTWNRVFSGEKINELIQGCIKKFDPSAPELILPDLITVYRQIQNLNSDDAGINFWKQHKLKETAELIICCAGVWVESSLTDFTAIPGNTIAVNTQIIKRNNCNAKILKINYLNQTDSVLSLALKTNELYNLRHTEKLNISFPFSNPYWLNQKHEVSRFIVKNPLLIGKPENEPALKVLVDVEIDGLDLQLERGIIYKFTDPVKGEVYRPVEILPPVTINISEKIFVFADAKEKNIQLVVKANAPGVKGIVQLKVTEGWAVEIKKPEFFIAGKGEEIIIEAIIKPGKTNSNGKLEAAVTIGEQSFSKSIKRIEYDHIPFQFILSEAEATLVKVNLKKTGTHIGYIPGAGDDVPACLKQIGYVVTTLNDDLLSHEDLSKYDAIITGIRAYNTNERLQLHYKKLMEYIHEGGNLIVQYNTNNRIGPVGSKIGPYPFTISRDRVTDENAEVKILKPENKIFTTPNLITAKDFEGWVQERGIYFASEIDKNYETLLAMNDANEKPLEGSLIVGKYGKGNFAYTGLVFFRELPAGVSGAYRLLVNLLSMPSNK
ncbi:MAG: hypothetical protein JWO32_541 [Bacteroidetes bacterium]|nr:hypothetical protein [Bacteroidota bacterium]